MSTDGVDDSELVDRARQGDTVAFGMLVDQYRTPVFRAALSALGSREDAEEVAQDAFVSAYRSLNGFRGDASFKTWLLSIVWRKALTRRKSVTTLMRRFVAPPADTEWQVPSSDRTQEQVVMDTELHRHLRRLISALSPKLRDALLLAATRDYTMDEIAQMLGAPAGTVKWRIAEARRQLKVNLKKIGYGNV